MSANYQVVTIDTAAVLTAQPIVPGAFRGAQVDYITVLQVPVGADCGIHIGETGQRIPLTDPIPFDICPPETTGIYVTVGTAGAGLIVLLVSFASGSVQGGTVP